jgi:hypothetical protein
MKNKITLLIAAFVLLFSFQTQAQLGVHIGYNFSKISGIDAGAWHEKYLPNLSAGLFFDKKIVPLIDIRIGAMYSPKGEKLTLGDYYSKTTLNYIEIPLQLKAKVGPLYGLAGVYGAYAVNGKIKSKADNGGGEVVETTDDLDFKEKEVKRGDFGLKFGAGLQYGFGPLKIFVQGDYSMGMMNLSSADETYKNKVIGASAGLIIGF